MKEILEASPLAVILLIAFTIVSTLATVGVIFARSRAKDREFQSEMSVKQAETANELKRQESERETARLNFEREREQKRIELEVQREANDNARQTEYMRVIAEFQAAVKESSNIQREVAESLQLVSGAFANLNAGFFTVSKETRDQLQANQGAAEAMAAELKNFRQEIDPTLKALKDGVENLTGQVKTLQQIQAQTKTDILSAFDAQEQINRDSKAQLTLFIESANKVMKGIDEKQELIIKRQNELASGVRALLEKVETLRLPPPESGSKEADPTSTATG